GIRVFHVTGVQTCALPICINCCGGGANCWSWKTTKSQNLQRESALLLVLAPPPIRLRQRLIKTLLGNYRWMCRMNLDRTGMRIRSEERRVGNGSRAEATPS